mmetsp:Transcript_385/g.1324  ORF Transcript_385/g.1324 Transcript_385/m.1324 type:complete len:225 (+) Transcript_385:1-675(+)
MLLLPFASDPHSSPDCLPAPLLGLPGRQQDADDLAVQQVLRVPVVILHLEVFVLGVEALDAPFEPAVAGEVFCDGPAHQAVRLLQLELAQRVERQILLVAIRVEQAESVLGVIGGDRPHELPVPHKVLDEAEADERCGWRHVERVHFRRQQTAQHTAPGSLGRFAAAGPGASTGWSGHGVRLHRDIGKPQVATQLAVGRRDGRGTVCRSRVGLAVPQHVAEEEC